MKPTILATLLALLPATLSAQTAGLREGEFHAPHHQRAVAHAIWYPASKAAPTRAFGANPVFLGTEVAPKAAPIQGRFPLVVLSHGLGGHYRSQGWLAAGLARAGAIVVAVNHPNSTAFDFDMQAGLRHWTRARDLTLALDRVLADPEFGHLVDRDRIAAIGFSYGGWTALSLAGVRGNLAGYIRHCEADPSRHCHDIARAGADLRSLDRDAWDGDHADPRITHVVALDPGLTFGLTANDVAGVSTSNLLIQLGSGADRLGATDISDAGSGLATLLPDAAHLEIAPAAHFSVLPLCTPNGARILEEERDDPVCTDPDGADRAAIHRQVLAATRAHLGLD